MSEEALIQIKMDSDLKEKVEALYQKMGTSFAEAVRIFARQSVEENAMPFTIQVPKRNVILGAARGKYVIPDNIDEHNDEIAAMFDVKK